MLARVRCTETVRRARLIALVALVAVTGCGSGDRGAAPTASARSASPGGAGSVSPGGAGSGSPAGSPSPSTLTEFTVDGAGPYQLGATLDELRSTPGLDEIKSGGPNCAQNTSARGTGIWRDVHLSFRADGVLYLAVNRSPSIPTPSGAWLGTTLAQLKTIYVNVAGDELVKGSHRGYLVTTLSGRGILFDLDAKKTVTAMFAADATYLRDSFAGGAGFC
jgi:hypothetical protein